MADEGTLQRMVMGVVETVAPDQGNIAREIADYRKAHPDLDRAALAVKWADRICWLYATEGAVTALPSAIPGLGTMAQIGVEVGTISADLAYMMRCMAGMVMGVGQIYERDQDTPFNHEFVRVLGLWCGVLNLSKEATKRVSTKVAVAQFKRVPAEIFKRINRKVGTTIVTKYGTKRGGIAIGRLVPFGVGAIVGGGFNLATMKAFKAAAIRYYATEDAILEETD
ncbi:MAG: hypothetical protein ABIO70_11820 [Pseudomonadota bacterium]